MIEGLNVKGRIEADKIDVVLTGDTANGPVFLGVVHVKASFAERRTDDVPLSETLIKHGYTSPLWTIGWPRSHGRKVPLRRLKYGRIEDYVKFNMRTRSVMLSCAPAAIFRIEPYLFPSL